MKKQLALCILLVITCSMCFSQARLNLYGNYAFDDHVDSYYSNSSYYSGEIKGGFLWGAGLEYRLQRYYGLELLYMRQDTKAPIDYFDAGPKHTNFDLGANYIMLAGERSIPVGNPKIDPYAGLMLGVCFSDLTDPDNNRSSSISKFAWGVRLGTNFWTSGRAGIKIQAQLLSVPQAVGGGFYFGSGGSGAGVATVSSIYQFAIGGGLVFKLGSR